jgi:ADP-heptose:LPS heptosyltransferase
MQALVHLASGIGNIVFATPLLIALNELGYTLDLRLSADYEATADLLHGWSVIRHIFTDADRNAARPGQYDAIVPAIPPFYWRCFQHAYRGLRTMVARPPDALFYQDEQAYYLAFARSLGYPAERRPEMRLPIGPSEEWRSYAATVLLAVGSKTGEMAKKRWPWFTQLAALLPDVAVMGTADDLTSGDGSPLVFAEHVRNFAGQLSLRQTAELMASSCLVVANDTGLAHVAAAVGTPAIVLFGPSPDRSLGPLPAHVTVLRSGLPCEPCWWGRKFAQCQGRIDCLRGLEVPRVLSAIHEVLANR